MKKVIFLDRDNTLNVDYGHVYKLEDFQLMPHVIQALQNLTCAGYELVIVTNQCGIEKGLFTLEDMEKFNKKLLDELMSNNIKVWKLFYSTSPDNTNPTRKPNTGLVDDFIKENNIDLKNSWMIGDKYTDVMFADNLGIRCVKLVGMNHAADIILKGDSE